MKAVVSLLSVCALLFQIETVFSQSEAHSQSTRLNWIFLVDGTVPTNSAYANCKIILPQEGGNDTIFCEYITGDILIPTDGLHQIMKDSNEGIFLEFTYIEIQESLQPLRYVYPIPLYQSFFNNSFVLFNIENVNIKKQLFSLSISSGNGYTIKCPYRKRKDTHNAFARGKYKIKHKIIRMNRVP